MRIRRGFAPRRRPFWRANRSSFWARASGCKIRPANAERDEIMTMSVSPLQPVDKLPLTSAGFLRSALLCEREGRGSATCLFYDGGAPGNVRRRTGLSSRLVKRTLRGSMNAVDADAFVTARETV
jgi:hypothetical protein